MAANIRNLLKYTEFISVDGHAGTVGLSWKGELDRTSLATYFSGEQLTAAEITYVDASFLLNTYSHVHVFV